MATTIELEAATRPGVGKGAARQARREGNVPGVVYGGNADPIAVNVKQPALLKLLRAGKFLSTLINLKIDGKDQTVICRGVQRDVVKDLPTHVDFLRLSERSRINLMIPVAFENEDTSPGIKRGGVLVVVRNEVELKVRAGNIPEELVVDMSELDVNDVVRISDIKLPDGAAPTITDRDFMIANISAPSALASAENESDDEEGGEEAAEGEEEATEE